MYMIAAVLLAAHIGVAAIDLDTGWTYAVHAEEHFPMGSVYKVPIALAVLRAVDLGELHLAEKVTLQSKDFSPGFSPIRDKAHGKPVTMTVEELLDATVRTSDNTASD